MSVDTGRRNALLGFSSVALGVAAMAAGPARAEAGSSVVPQGAHALPELMERLRKAPRRRDFKTVVHAHPRSGNVNADVLADKDPHFTRVNFCSVIRESAWRG